MLFLGSESHFNDTLFCMQTYTEVKNPSLILFDTFPKRAPAYHLRVRTKSGQILLTQALVDMLAFGDTDIPAFMAFAYDSKGRMYLTRSTHPKAFRVQYKWHNGAVVGATTCSRGLVRHLAQTLNIDTLFANLPVVQFQTQAAEVGLSPVDHPYPLYRIAVENIVKED